MYGALYFHFAATTPPTAQRWSSRLGQLHFFSWVSRRQMQRSMMSSSRCYSCCSSSRRVLGNFHTYSRKAHVLVQAVSGLLLVFEDTPLCSPYGFINDRRRDCIVFPDVCHFFHQPTANLCCCVMPPHISVNLFHKLITTLCFVPEFCSLFHS